jgi:hypothetical protein
MRAAMVPGNMKQPGVSCLCCTNFCTFCLDVSVCVVGSPASPGGLKWLPFLKPRPFLGVQPNSRFDEMPEEPLGFDPFKGSFDTEGDPATTNLYVGNLAPQVCSQLEQTEIYSCRVLYIRRSQGMHQCLFHESAPQLT